MPTIGILLPSSTLYPSIGFEFLDGLKACLDLHQFTDCKFAVYSIGYGLNDDEIKLRAEKLFLEDQADMVVVFGEHRVVPVLDALAASAGKLVIVTNGGANYPVKEYQPRNVIQHSLNSNVYAHLTGRLCGSTIGGENSSVISCTSYYDGGYRHSHAIETGLEAVGREVAYRFVGHFKKENFTLAPLEDYLKSQPGPHRLVCTYSGDVARFFFEQIVSLQKTYALELYGSMMMFDKTPGDYSADQALSQNLRGYTGWFPELDIESNRRFVTLYKESKAKDPNLFSMQGWEVAVLLMNAWRKLEAKKNVPDVLKEMQAEPIASPRGMVRLQPDHTVTAPAYLVSTAEDGSLVVQDTIEETGEAHRQMLGLIPDSPSSSWLNTYLCI
jgi:branched-chain amino acid transport system substrate-binding protein